MHRRLGNSAVPGNLLGLARLYERIINDEPPLAIQGARIGSHSVFHFFHRQMCCCTRDSCHTFPLLFSVITSFILSQYADWYERVGSARLSIVGVIGKRTSHNEQTLLIDRHLRIVILLKTSMRRAFHDARLWIGKIVLVVITWSFCWWGWWTTTWAASRRALSLLAQRQLGLILRLLGCHSLLGTGF